MEKKYQWFAEPWGDDLTLTNEIISQLPSVFLDGADTLLREMDNQGDPHNVWRLPLSEISELWAERKRLGISFRIYNRIGGHGPIRDVTFLFEKKSKSAR